MSMSIACLVPAHNEARSIAKTIETLLAQSTPFDLIVILSNGSTDATVDIARTYESQGVVVEDLPKLEHKKVSALNFGWAKYCRDASLVVTVDADTELEPDAVDKWMKEFEDILLAGSQAKFTMRGKNLLTRLQKAEYALGIDRSLKRKKTTILAGASSCYRNRYLKRVMESDEREGPWSYDSAVEDFELTYRLRAMGLRCIVSPSIRAYTDAMPNMKHLRAQRLKWQTGTIEDIIRFGMNKYTWESWAQQIIGLFLAVITMAWISLLMFTLALGHQVFSLFSWWTLIPLLSAMVNIKNSLRIPSYDWIDVAIGGTLIVGEVYGIIRLVWMVHAWTEVIIGKITKKRKDRWQMQGMAEGIYDLPAIDIAPSQVVS